MEIVLTAGAEDMRRVDDSFEITTDPNDFEAVTDALKAAGIATESADISMVPETEVKLDGAEAERMLKLMELLEDHDDMQAVSANFDIPDEIIERVLA